MTSWDIMLSEFQRLERKSSKELVRTLGCQFLDERAGRRFTNGEFIAYLEAGIEADTVAKRPKLTLIDGGAGEEK